MSRSPVTLTNFGALDLTSNPALIPFERGMDSLNVEHSARGSVRQRGGYAAFTSETFTNQPDSLGVFLKSDGTRRLLVGAGNSIIVFDATGTVVPHFTTPTASPQFFQRFGGPTIEAIYIANGTDQVHRYDTAGGFTTPAGLSGQTGRFLAITPESNRLIVARESGATGGNNPSSVNFSDAGDPETFPADNWIDLDPGDGEAIMGMIPWQGRVFIFKQSKLWFHWGEAVDATGEAIFEVKKVDSGGIGLMASRALASSPMGVFFLHSTGVYLTTGGIPERISEPIDGFFEGNAQAYFRSNPINHASIDKAAMCWHDNRLYVAVPTGGSSTNDRMLVFDPSVGWWLYDMPAAALVSFAIQAQTELVFARSDALTVARHKTGETRYGADDMASDGTGGTAISSRWRSGWTDFDTQSEKHVHHAELYGNGTIAVRVYTDYAIADAVDGHAQTLEFGTGGGPLFDDDVFYDDDALYGGGRLIEREGWTKGRFATVVSLACSNQTLNVSWQLNVATFFVTSRREPGLKH